MKSKLPVEDDAQKGVDAAANLLKALANRNRLLLVCRLTDGECNVSQLEKELGIVQPMLSQQLRILRQSNVVKCYRQGKQVYYALNAQNAHVVIETLCRLYVPPGKKFFHLINVKR